MGSDMVASLIFSDCELPRQTRNAGISATRRDKIECASTFDTSRRPLYLRGGLPNWRLKRALEMLDAGLTEAPSISTLAAEVGLHPTSFCRSFRQSMGISAHRYLLEKRIGSAKKLMANRTLTLTQIALDCGFSSSSQFSVMFRRLVGTSPRIYRKTCK